MSEPRTRYQSGTLFKVDQDTMKGPHGANSGDNSARVHGILLSDPDKGSAVVPPGETITREQWLAQQHESSPEV